MAITIVKDLHVGQIWSYEKVICVITGFPTRSMVCLKNIDHTMEYFREWNTSKTSVRDLKGKGRYYRNLELEHYFKKSMKSTKTP